MENKLDMFLLFFQKSVHGSTAVIVVHRPKSKKLYCAWVGDSQAVVVKKGVIQPLVNPHKPERKVSEFSKIRNVTNSGPEYNLKTAFPNRIQKFLIYKIGP